MFKHILILVLILLLPFLTVYSSDIEVTPLQIGNNTAGDILWDHFYLANDLPSGISNFIAEYPAYWGANQAGSYKNIPEIGNYKMNDGIVLSTGNAIDCIGPNDHGTKSGQGGFPGDQEINQIIGSITNDVAALKISFKNDSTIKGFTFTYAFGSEEYPAYVGSQYNDAFVVILDGENICNDINNNFVSVNNSLFNIDNNDTPSINLQWNGFTYVVKVSEQLLPGNHTIKFAVADVGDFRLDSGVFLSNFKFSYDSLSNIPLVDIASDQEFSVTSIIPAGTIIGEIESKSLFGPVTHRKLSLNDDFKIENWNIISKKDVTLSLNETKNLLIEGKLDTTWNNKNWIVLDTFNVTIKNDNTELMQNKGIQNSPKITINSKNRKAILNFNRNNIKNIKISIYNMRGRYINKNQAYNVTNTEQIQFETDKLSKGNYICRITEKGSSIKNIQFLITE